MVKNKPKTQIQLVGELLAGETEGICGGNGNLKIVGNQLIHYQTVIAEKYTNGVILNHTRYSIVTGRIKKMIKEKVLENKLISIGKIPEGFKDSLLEKVKEVGVINNDGLRREF